MPVYCRFESGLEVRRLTEDISGFMDAVRTFYADDPQFFTAADLVAIGKAHDSIYDVLFRLSKATFDYHAYLKSPDWKAKRDDRVKAAGGRCQVCNARQNLECHHRTYERIGHELPEDLIVLCDGCHGLFHSNGRLAKP
jgi:hypothetical protein